MIYIAALHSSELDSATFKIIMNTVEKENVALMILEGFRYSLGISPEVMANWAVKQYQNGVYDGFETAYSLSLATQKKIPFIGCEPDDSAIYTQILKCGYNVEDLLFCYFVQQTFQANEAQSKADSQTLFKKLMKSKQDVFELETEPTYNEFQEWYLKKNGRQFVPSLIGEDVSAPYENGELFTQRVSSVICKIRDQFILARIEDAMNTHNTVLVVCGGSHWSLHRN